MKKKLNSGFIACAYLICVCVLIALGLEKSGLRDFVMIPAIFGIILCIILPACSFDD